MCGVVDSSCVTREGYHTVRNTQYARCRSKENGFSLIEAVTALIILALVSSSVMVVINRCMESTADFTLRMQAFEVARENIEKLLASESVKEMAEFGSSDKYPEINWETVVEMFTEPITSQMWVKAVCSAEYTDTAGEVQTVELIHWLTDVTKEQLLEIMKEKEGSGLASAIIGTIEEAAEYAGVDVPTVRRWLEDGMLKTEDGSFVKSNIDLYKRSGGKPSPEDKSLQIESTAELLELTKDESELGEREAPDTGDWREERDPATGLTYGELEEMDFEDILKLIKERAKKEF